MRWLNSDRLGTPEEPITVDECVDRMMAEDNEVMDLRHGPNTPIHTLLVKRDPLHQEAKELRPSELNILADKIKRNSNLNSIEKLRALAFLQKNQELWDETTEEELSEEENTPNPAWDKVRWLVPAYKVYLNGLNNKPIMAWALNRQGRNNACRYYKLSKYQSIKLMVLAWAYFGAVEEDNKPDHTWFVQPTEVERSAYLWGYMPFKKTIHTAALKRMALAIELLGSRFQLKTMLDQYNKRIKEAKLTKQQKSIIGKDIKRLWDMWKMARYNETKEGRN